MCVQISEARANTFRSRFFFVRRQFQGQVATGIRTRENSPGPHLRSAFVVYLAPEVSRPAVSCVYVPQVVVSNNTT